jgi:uncharacterized protein
MPAKTAIFRFYEELNDFLPAFKRKIPFPYHFTGNPSIFDAIQALGVPHVEVDLILVNGRSVNFSYKIKDQDYTSVYPVFESFDISSVTRLRKKPLRHPRFILDAHLGKLTKYLRLFGFDCLYENSFTDNQIIEISTKLHRVILTRDLGILKHKQVTRGYWVRNTQPKEQLPEILKRFDLYSLIAPFGRCMLCNGKIKRIAKIRIQDQLPPRTLQYYDKFYICMNCSKLYWEGSHYDKMQLLITTFYQPDKIQDKN